MINEINIQDLAEKSAKDVSQLIAIQLIINTFKKQFPNYEIIFKRKEIEK